MGRARVAALALAAVIAGLTVPASASAGVSFVDQEPATLTTTGATATVELLNGSPRPQQLALRVLRATDVTLEPAAGESETTDPGRPRSFTLTLKATPAQPGSRTLLATSSDGSSARLKLLVGTQLEVGDVPKTLDLGVATTGDATTIVVAGLPEVAKSRTVGQLYSAGGASVAVTLEPKRTLRVAATEESGAYSGQIKIDGTESALSLDVRDDWKGPLVLLIAGVLVGLAVEVWLTRWRPQSLLDRRLGRLLGRAERRRQRVDGALEKLFLEARPAGIGEHGSMQVWRVPKITTLNSGVLRRYYLSRSAYELAIGLEDARTDPERALFGPDGDLLKGLLTDEDTYAELVGDLLEAVEVARADFGALREQGPIPLRSRFDHELRGWIIGDKPQLTARRDSAKALRKAAEHFSEYRRRLFRVEDRAAGNAELVRKAQVRRRLLERTFRGDDDQIDWWDDGLPKLEAELVTPAAPEARSYPRRAAERPPALLPEPVAPGAPPGPAPPHPPPPWPAGPGTFRDRALVSLEGWMGAINLAIIIASGFSLLYLTNDTFGSLADYLGVVLWGSTATAGVALVRRLLPGALTSAQTGVR